MYLYWVRLGDAAFMTVPEGMGWRLSCEMDGEGGYAAPASSAPAEGSVSAGFTAVETDELPF